MKAIGIDIGTTSVCGVLLDVEKQSVIKSRTKNSNAFLKGCAEWEKIQSVEKITAAAAEILDEFIECEESGKGDIAVIGVTGQMHGITYLDKHGKSLSPLYIWQDGRGSLPYRGTTYAKYLNSFSGYGNVTDLYNRENGIRPSGAVSYCTIHDYFVMQLCGLEKPIMHTSDAASLGCFDLSESRFDYDCDIDVTADYRIAGEYRGIPVSVAIGDNQASVFSSLADNDDVLLNVGTGSQVSVISDRPVTAENIETRPYFDGRYLVVGSALCGGRAYSLLKSFYSEILEYVCRPSEEEVYGIMNKMLERAEDTRLTVDTRFAGTRSNAGISGSISGLTTESFNPTELTLGTLRGMVCELFEMYKLMNVKSKGAVGSGNGIRKNPALTHEMEKMFGLKIKIPKHLEEASLGAALFGLTACGAFKNSSERKKLIKYNI